MVLYVVPEEPPPNIPVVELDVAAKYALATVKSPKSVASPKLSKLKYSIVLTALDTIPPPAKPLVLDELALK